MPSICVDPIQHEPAIRVAIRVPVAVEVVLRVVAHAQSTHHCPGTVVDGGCVRDNLMEPDFIEGEIEHRRRTLGRIALAPGVDGQMPADMD